MTLLVVDEKNTGPSIFKGAGKCFMWVLDLIESFGLSN